jgi:cytochrome c oxidase subunit 2
VFTSIQGKYDSQERISPRILSNFLRAAVSLIAVAAVMVCLGESSTKTSGARRIEVVARRYAFEPAEITVKKGESVDLILTTSDVNHGVRIRELGIDLRVGKGKKAEVTFTPHLAGTFVGHCSVFCGSGHGQMTLTIHVGA